MKQLDLTYTTGKAGVPFSTDAWIQDFLDYLRTERSASLYTLRNYELDLRRWFRFLFEKKNFPDRFDQLTELKNLREFLADEGREHGKATLARRLSTLKSFFKFLYREKRIERNLSRLMRLPKVPESLPFVLRPEETIQLIEGVEPKSLFGKRTRAILELLYSTGMRVSELADLTQEKVDLRGNSLLVRGKGNKERLVPFGRHSHQAIKEYMDAIPANQRRKVGMPLFLNRDGEKLSVRTIQRDIQKFATEILGDRGKKVTPHTFRHSCATHLLSRGAGLREIQELLGHRSLVTTQKYTQVDSERLMRLYETTHPKGSKKGKQN